MSPDIAPRDPDFDGLREDFASLARATAPATAHPDEDTWVRFGSGDLAAGERDRLADHVLTCDECRALYRAVEHVWNGASAIDGAAPRVAVAQSRRPPVWLAVAAGLLLAVAGLIFVRSSRPTEPASTDRVESTAPAALTAPVAPAGPRAWALGTTAPEVRLPAYLALSVRGADKERDELLEALGEGIAPYREGRFGEAADRLAPLAARRPDVPEIAFYLGVSRLLAGDPSSAIASLRHARASEVLSHDARWYEAVALERSGRRQDADAALRELCKLPSPYQAGACAPVREKQ